MEDGTRWGDKVEGKEGELVQGSLKADDLLGLSPSHDPIWNPACACCGLDYGGAHTHWITTGGDE